MPTTKSIIALIWVLAISVVAACNCVAAAKPILQVGLENTAEKVVISSSSNSPFSVGVFKSSSGRFLGFEFRGVLLNSGKLVSIRSGRIHNIKYASFQNSPPVSRMVINTSSTPEYTLVMAPDKKQAIITIWKQASPKRGPDAPAKIVTPDDTTLVARGDVPATKVALAATSIKESEKLPALGEKVLANVEEVRTPPLVVAKAEPKATISIKKAVAKTTPGKVVVKPKAVKYPKPVVFKSYTKSDPRISLSFADAEVVDVLKALALQSRRNIVVSKAVGGKITLNLSGVTPDQALNLVTKMSGYSFVRQGDTYLVGTKASLLSLATNEDLNLKVEAIMLSYATPNDVISILQARFPDLKIRKSDVGWRMLKATTDSTNVSVKTESKKSVGLVQSGQSQQSDQIGQSGSGTNSKLPTQPAAKSNEQSGGEEMKQSQSGEDSEATSFTDEATGRGEQTKGDSNLLIISGTDVIVEQAKLLVAELEKAVYTSSLENTFEIYKLKFVKADGLADSLRQLIPGITIRRAPQAGLSDIKMGSVEGDPVRAEDKAIIISGRQKDVQSALTIVARLDTADTLDTRKDTVVEMIALKNISGEDVSKAITQSFPGLKVSLIAASEYQKKATDANVINNIPENRASTEITNRNTGSILLLSGPQDLIIEAKALITGMDSALQGGALFNGDNEPKKQLKLEKYEVRYVNPVELAMSIRTLIPAVAVTFAPSEGFDLSGPGEISLASTGATITQTTKAAPQKQEAAGDKVTVSPNVRSLLLLGPEADVKRALELAPTLDIKSPQIKIVAKITSITENAGKNLGLTWSWGDLNYKEQGLGTWIRNPIDFSAKLDALYNSGDIQILSTPSMTILEGKPGVFFVGDEITYITLIQQTATGQNVTTEKSLVGIQLKANGRVSSDGFITLNLHPEVSTIKLSETSVAGVSLPTTSRRFTDQVVRVKDGETYVVGGLIRTDEISGMTKVPLLADIPFFGNMFRHSTKTKQKTEVVMFITATIIKD
jgi:type II secretory pathway component GspD/PulD (secretin)